MSDASMEKAAYKKEKDKDYENATRIRSLIVGSFRNDGNKSSLPPSDIAVDDEMALDSKLPPNQHSPSHSEALHEMEMSLNDEDAQEDEGDEMKMRSLLVGSFRELKDKSSLSTIAITIDEAPSSNRQAQRRASSCSFEGSTATHPTVELTLEAFHDEMNCSHHSISPTEHNDLMNETLEGETSDPNTIPLAECVLDIENQTQSETSIPRPALVTSITTGTLVDDVEIPVAALVPEEKGFKIINLRNKRIKYVYLISLLLMLVSLTTLLVVTVGKDNSNKAPASNNTITEVTPTTPPAISVASYSPITTTVVATTTPEQSREEKIRNIIGALTADKALNKSTPQHQALVWLLNDPQQKNLPFDHPRIIQRYILSLLYYQLNGSNWINSTGYLTGEEECNWFGVSCDDKKAATALVMGSNNLYGEIPNEIVELTSLGILDLGDNFLHGKIPPNMHKLVVLTLLNLRSNNLSGQIPPEIGDMTKLNNLFLFRNKLSGQIPPSIGQLKKLSRLKLFENSLSGTIPRELSEMTKLVFLSLSNNDLNGTIPPELGTMEELVELSLFGNYLVGGIPEELSKLRKLINLRLHHNKLTGEIPSSFGQLESLKSLHLHVNDLYGKVPASVCNLMKLKELFVDCWKIECSCCKCNPAIKDASTTSAATSPQPPITGTTTTITIDPVRGQNVRNKILGLTKEKALNKSTPQYQALKWLLYVDPQQLPHDHPRIIQRYVLSLLYYQLNGSNWINSAGYLTGVDECNWFGVSCNGKKAATALVMGSNNLYDEIPNEIVELPFLKRLVLEDNFLHGKIPPNMHKLKKLATLNLRSNNLLGQIPPEIGDMTNLRNLYLNNNSFSGQIPPSIGQLKKLSRLKLFNNSLSGTIPRELSEMKSLYILELSNNTLNGTIPPELGTMDALDKLSLFGNNLVGGIPEELSKLTTLIDLRLYRNKLTGEIPSSFGQLKALKSLHLQENDLYGNVPASVCNLKLEELFIDCPKVGCSCCDYCEP